MRQLIVLAGSACPLFKLAAFGLALAFNLSCSDNKDDGSSGNDSDGLSSSSVSGYPNGSSSSGGGSNPTGGSSSSGSSEPQASTQDEFVDQRDGKRYKYEVSPDKLVWMSENLNYSKNGTIGWCYGNYETGYTPPFNTSARASEALGAAGKDGNGCNRPYGRAYTYAMAMDNNSPKGICPDGWHIPSVTEWDGISNGWESSRPKSMSSSFYVAAGNFNLNPDYPPLAWKDKDKFGYYWANAETDISFFMMEVNNGELKVYSGGNVSDRVDYFSVRCIMDKGGKLPCGSSLFDPVTEFCVSDQKYNRCNGEIYNPTLYTCNSGTLTCLSNLPSGYLCFGGSMYQSITVGNQIWMTENLNLNGTDVGSCYYMSNSGCDDWRYNWATAMNLPNDCNSSDCTELIETPHQGICPVGWHIPKSDEIKTGRFFRNDTWWTATQELGHEAENAYYKLSSGDIEFSKKSIGRYVRCLKD